MNDFSSLATTGVVDSAYGKFKAFLLFNSEPFTEYILLTLSTEDWIVASEKDLKISNLFYIVHCIWTQING